jgi:SAM-dependent methyltransferase
VTVWQDVEQAVRARYSDAARDADAKLCCAVEYDRRYLEAIPQEILERDYGCGDPSRYLRHGETVLDLGSGGGKICYIAAQVVGSAGRVIGVDMNDEMLELAERHHPRVAATLGYDNVTFHKGRIQDLALDHRGLESFLESHPVRTAAELERLDAWTARQRQQNPMIASDSVDVVVSNCVLNLVRWQDKPRLFEEMYRVVRNGGRVVISDIVCDEEVPQELQRDPDLWSGCISGAYREDEFLRAFERAGFHGIRVLRRDVEPWQVTAGFEFRSITIEAHKGKEGPCLDRTQAVIYKGPWRSVTDDDGHTLLRGKRMAVCDKTFGLYAKEPYAGEIIAVEPYDEVPLDEAPTFDCSRDVERHPRETKGRDYDVTRASDAPCCGPDDDCC